MCNPDLLQRIEQSVKEINKLRDTLPLLLDDWELVLELGKDSKTGEPICSYHFVRHSTCCLFWLHEFDLKSVLDGLCGVTKNTHIRKSTPVAPDAHQTDHTPRPGITSPVLVSDCPIVVMTSWLITPRSHWEMFPENREIPEELSQELSGILLHAGIGTPGPALYILWLTVTQTV